MGKWVANMVDDSKSREEATLSRRRIFDGINRPVESVMFALLVRAMNNLVHECRIDLHIPNLGLVHWAARNNHRSK